MLVKQPKCIFAEYFINTIDCCFETKLQLVCILGLPVVSRELVQKMS
jgi:hypothetical protein